MDKYLNKLPGTESRFQSGDKITVTLRGAMIRENEDWTKHPLKGKNDLFIMTTYQFAQDTPVKKIHMIENEVDLGWQGDFFTRTILAMSDFKDIDEALTLHLQIYDIDKWTGYGFLDDLEGIAKSAAAAFPALSVYAMGAPIIKSVVNLADSIDKHDKIIDERIVLESDKEDSGHKLLQKGYYVCFRKPVDTKKALFINSDMRVVNQDNKEFEDCSYAVIEVSKDFKKSQEFEIDQSAAKLASELTRKEHGDKAPIEFLRDTLSYYTKFKDLERARELREKRKLAEKDSKNEKLNPSEIDLLDKLEKREDLKPYLN
jgi:hypothetical protein